MARFTSSYVSHTSDTDGSTNYSTSGNYTTPDTDIDTETLTRGRGRSPQRNSREPETGQTTTFRDRKAAEAKIFYQMSALGALRSQNPSEISSRDSTSRLKGSQSVGSEILSSSAPASSTRRGGKANTGEDSSTFTKRRASRSPDTGKEIKGAMKSGKERNINSGDREREKKLKEKLKKRLQYRMPEGTTVATQTQTDRDIYSGISDMYEPSPSSTGDSSENNQTKFDTSDTDYTRTWGDTAYTAAKYTAGALAIGAAVYGAHQFAQTDTAQDFYSNLPSMNEASTMAANTAQSAWANTSAYANDLGTIFSSFADETGNGLSTYANAASTGIASTAGSLWDGISSNFGQLTETAGAWKDSAVGSEAYGTASRYVPSMTDLSGAMSGVGDYLGGTWGTVRDATNANPGVARVAADVGMKAGGAGLGAAFRYFCKNQKKVVVEDKKGVAEETTTGTVGV